MNQINNLNINSKKLFINSIIKKLLFILIVILFTFTIISNVIIVQENEIVLIKGFFKTDKIIEKPGIYFKLPIVQTTTIISKNLMLIDSQPTRLLTKDNKNIITESLIIWKVNNASMFLNTMQNTISAELKIDNTVSSALNLIANKYNFTDITSEQVDNKFDSLMLTNLNKELNIYGIDIIDFKVKNIYVPKENEDAIYSRMKSERTKIATQYISDGEKNAIEIKAQADKEAKIILSDASAYSEELKGKADAEAAKLYAESYKQDPEFYKFLRTMESYKKMFKGKPTIVLPIQSPYAKYLLGQ